MDQHGKQGELAQDAAAQARQTRQHIEAFLRCSAGYLGLPWPVVLQVEQSTRNTPDAE